MRQTRVKAGETYGKLTILAINTRKDKHGRFMSDCKCECGKLLTVRNTHLTGVNSPSCGCSKGYQPYKQVEFRGKARLVIELAAEYDICRATLEARLRRGWSVEKAVTAPPRQTNREYR